MSHQILFRALIALGLVFYLFVFPHGIHGDGGVRYKALLLWMARGELTPMFYSYVGPVISSPLYLLGSIVKDGYWWVSRFNTFLILGAAWGFWRYFRGGWSLRQSRAFLLLFLFASMFPKHSTDYYSEVFTTVLAAGAILFFLRGSFLLGAGALLLATWNTPGTIGAAALLCLYFFVKDRSLRYVLLVPLFVAGILGENWLKYGELSPTAYLTASQVKSVLPYSGGPGFIYPLFFGLLSILLSFGKGLAFYCPGLFAGFAPGVYEGSAGAFLKAGLFYFLGLLLVYSRWWAWSGDVFWGPRFFLFASLWGAVALAATLPEPGASGRKLAWWTAAVALSLWVGCQGITFGFDFQELCYGEGSRLDYVCHYVPEFSALWRPFVVGAVPRGRQVGFVVYFALVAMMVLAWPLRELLGKGLVWGRTQLQYLVDGKPWRL